MADPLSIAASCIAVITAAGQTAKVVRDFVRDFSHGQADVSCLSQEISQLNDVLQSIRDVEQSGDIGQARVPQRMQAQLIALVDNCRRVLAEIDEILTWYLGGSGARAAHWALSGKKKIEDQAALLEGHRKALELCLTTIDFSISCSIKVDTTALLADSHDNRGRLEELLQLVKLLPGSGDYDDSDTVQGRLDIMSRYLESLTMYTASVREDAIATGNSSLAAEFRGPPFQSAQGQHPVVVEGLSSATQRGITSQQRPAPTPSPPLRPASFNKPSPTLGKDQERMLTTRSEAKVLTRFPVNHGARLKTISISPCQRLAVYNHGENVTVWNIDRSTPLVELTPKTKGFGVGTIEKRLYRFFQGGPTMPVDQISFLGKQSNYIVIGIPHNLRTEIQVWDWMKATRHASISVYPQPSASAWVVTRGRRQVATPDINCGTLHIFRTHDSDTKEGLEEYEMDNTSSMKPFRRRIDNVAPPIVRGDLASRRLLALSADGKTVVTVRQESQPKQGHPRNDFAYISVCEIADNRATGMRALPNATGNRPGLTPRQVEVNENGTRFGIVWVTCIHDAFITIIEIQSSHLGQEGKQFERFLSQPMSSRPALPSNSRRHCKISPSCQLLAYVDHALTIYVSSINLDKPLDIEQQGVEADRIAFGAPLKLCFKESGTRPIRFWFSSCSRSLFALSDQYDLCCWDIESLMREHENQRGPEET
ncbi:hypothetical protein QBC47DRAFT_174591 [Echria macrotheca]|uniref:Azaphilone pigments biosynthesis cluster protein L N-terminal domain-containing protein n=1 Tax=Echria macrotheca TaxID=438768 RepID=A0AAJ0BEZ2_9PEZI|nr:hypothetical protein QBC47DRAFT_174591 [Echria macrotheca]